jgi:ADP-heptose:LPS heptosyltransferase
LADKKYREGWQLYENRFKLALFSKEYVQSPMPFWDGKTDITNKKLLLIWEQGVGDVIQFIRFIPLLKQKTKAHICFVCGPSLARLAGKIQGVDMMHITTNLPTHDYKVYLLSLPLILGLFKEEQFLTDPYIQVDKKLVETWQHKLPKTKPYKIGICWMGGVKYSYNLERNCTLGQFVKLLENNAYQLIILQKELTPEDKELLSYSPILSVADELVDFSETAAVIANLDLVITVDTSIGHLAGAMGKPVWLLIRYETEWRHPRDSDISPWYPSMRLFRQPNPGDWDGVFASVTQALADQFPPEETLHEKN